jgi:hypothetical protein
MELIRACCVALVCCLFAVASNAQSPAPKVGATASATATTPDPVQETKIKALEEEVRTFKEFTQHILSTVYFALTTVVVIVVAMLGFSWYQNFKVYERDKEAMRQALTASLNEQLRGKIAELESGLRDRFLNFDSKIADALEKIMRRLEDTRLSVEASIFQSAHFEKTPRTDFAAFCMIVRQSIDHVSTPVLAQALSVIVQHVEGLATIDSPTRMSLLDLANHLPKECSPHAESIRALLAKTK